MKTNKIIINTVLLLALSMASTVKANETVIATSMVKLAYTEVRDISCSIDNISVKLGSIQQFKKYRYETAITGNCSRDLTINIYPITDSINRIAVGANAKLNIGTSNSIYFANNLDGGRCKVGSPLSPRTEKNGCHISIPFVKGGNFSKPISFNIIADGKNLKKITHISGLIPVQVSVAFNE